MSITMPADLFALRPDSRADQALALAIAERSFKGLYGTIRQQIAARGTLVPFCLYLGAELDHQPDEITISFINLCHVLGEAARAEIAASN